MRATSIAFADGKYQLKLEDGSHFETGTITSEGKPRKDDLHFDHVIRYSDGVVKRAVLSTRIAIVPDCSLLD